MSFFLQIASSSSYLGMNVANHFAVKNFESQITIGYVLGNPKTDTVIMQIGFAIYLPQTAISSKKKDSVINEELIEPSIQCYIVAYYIL